MNSNDFIAQIQQNPMQPTWVSGIRVNLDKDTQFQWSTSFTNSKNVLASIMDVNPLVDGLSLILGSATQVSTWTSLLINNIGAFPFSLKGYGGSEISAPAPGKSLYVYLTDNSTEGGIWKNIAFGVGTSSAVAAELSGAGLIALMGRLNVNCPVTVLSLDSTIDDSYRGSLVVWGGQAGTGSITFSPLSSGVYLYISNQSTRGGTLTINAPVGWKINGLDNVSFNPGEGAQFVADTTTNNIYMIGFSSLFGSNITVNSVTGLTGGELTLTQVQMSSIIQEFSGTLQSDQSIYVRNFPSVYIVFNGTSGGRRLLFGMSNRTLYEVPQQKSMLFYCDGANVYIAPTAYFIEKLTLDSGSASFPSFNWSENTLSGFFYNDGTAIAANGNRTILFPDDQNTEKNIQLFYTGDSPTSHTNNGGIVFSEIVSGNTFSIIPPSSIKNSFSLKMPNELPQFTSLLTCDSLGNVEYSDDMSTSPNILIGGNFSLNPFQRKNSASESIPFPSNSCTYIADRFFIYTTDAVSFDISGSDLLSSYSYLDSTRELNCLYISYLGANSSGACFFGQGIEGTRFLSLLNGYPITLSFFCAGTSEEARPYLNVSLILLMSGGNKKSCVGKINVLNGTSPNIRTYTFPPFPSGTREAILSKNLTDCFLALAFTFDCAPKYRTNTLNSWQNGSFLASSDTFPNMRTSYIYIGSIKLESGEQATPYIIPSFQQELMECQRYYRKSYPQGIQPGTPTYDGSHTTSFPFGMAIDPNVIIPLGVHPCFDIPMRTSPHTVKTYFPGGQVEGGWAFCGVEKNYITPTNISNRGFLLSNTMLQQTLPTAGNPPCAQGHYTADADFNFADISAFL